MKTKFWTINLALTLTLSSVYATSPEVDGGPLLKIEQYDLTDKDLSVELGSFKQSIEKVEVLNDKIKIIPQISPANTVEMNTHISYASVCLVKKLTLVEFRNLRFVEVQGATYMPSVNGALNSITTIGTDTITLNAMAPLIGGQNNEGLMFSSSIENTIVDSLERSDRYIYNKVGAPDELTDFGKSRFIGPVLPINYFVISLNIKSQTDKEAFGYLKPNQVLNEMIVQNGFEQQYNPEFYFGYSKEDTEGWMSFGWDLSDLGSTSSNALNSTYEYSSKAAPQATQMTEPKVELCWSTHNYESVTTGAPVLIAPKITLGLIK